MKIIITNLVTPYTSKGFINVDISELDICLGKTSIRIKETLSKEEKVDVGVRRDIVAYIVNMFITATPDTRDRLEFELDLVMKFYNSRYRNPADSNILMLLIDVVAEFEKINSTYNDSSNEI